MQPRDQRNRQRPDRQRRETSSTGSRPAGSSSAGSSSAGARSVARRAEREQEKRRASRTTYLIAGGVAVVLLIVVVLIVTSPAASPIPESAVTRYEGVQSGRTQEGLPQVGDPEAPVRVELYSSFDCAPCKQFHDNAMDELVSYARNGDVRLIFVPLYQQGTAAPNGQGAAIAALCAGEQNRFWPYADALFSWQGVYGNQTFITNRLRGGADALGLNVSQFDACLRGGEPEALRTASANASALVNFVAAPAIAINGVVPTENVEGEEVAIPLTNVEAILAAVEETIAVTPREAEPEATDEASAATAEPTDDTAAESTEAATADAPAEETPPPASADPTDDVTEEAD